MSSKYRPGKQTENKWIDICMEGVMPTAQGGGGGEREGEGAAGRGRERERKKRGEKRDGEGEEGAGERQRKESPVGKKEAGGERRGPWEERRRSIEQSICRAVQRRRPLPMAQPAACASYQVIRAPQERRRRR
jgi:hypothetical protein